MSKGWTGCLVVVGVVLLVLLVVAGSLAGVYNGLVTQNEQVKNAWAQVQNVLQRRADLIPNLVETVKGYASHEKEVFETVAEARSKLAGATTPREAATANAGLNSALARLLAIAENYPNLKANENFIRLQDELAGTENRIAVERMRYNDAVRAYNTAIKRFPTNLVASVFRFGEREYFEAEEGAKEVPKVKF
ncbi:MAG TPA: LemA family protein [Candidatus Polarisedimenticolia bacterium]|nr:LemA family protein [Candidatus Polarisedimenticolia bacterium]